MEAKCEKALKKKNDNNNTNSIRLDECERHAHTHTRRVKAGERSRVSTVELNVHNEEFSVKRYLFCAFPLEFPHQIHIFALQRNEK